MNLDSRYSKNYWGNLTVVTRVFLQNKNLLQYKDECFFDQIKNYKPIVLFEHDNTKYLDCREFQVVELEPDVEAKGS